MRPTRFRAKYDCAQLSPGVLFVARSSGNNGVTSFQRSPTPYEMPLSRVCCRFGCYRVEQTISRAGVVPAEVQRLSRRTITPTETDWFHLEFTERPALNCLLGNRVKFDV